MYKSTITTDYTIAAKNTCSIGVQVFNSMTVDSTIALLNPSVRASIYKTLPFFFSQDYHWQWRSFLTSGFTAVYFLVYAIHYFFSKLQITGLASTILYFGYTMIMALIFFLFTGRYEIRVDVFFHLGLLWSPSFSCTHLQN